MPTESGYHYKVGGSLAFNHPTYVERKADRELLEFLKAGHFCYVFNCRQMGKSSLRVRAMHQLQAEGMLCVSIDITSLGSDLSQEQWYSGIISQLFLGFNLVGKVNLKVWLREREELPPLQKLGQFIEEILLVRFPEQRLFIFIDEIDKVLSLKFSLDDFFSWIRFCYNQRADNSQYARLSFALFGVATPSDLIEDKTQTPFNIGQGIELTGFTLEEASPLAVGLPEEIDDSKAVLKEILDWTGGQPFLTQKLCQILLNSSISIAKEGKPEVIKNLVESQVIENWESQDEPVHLKTIRDRLLNNEQKTGRLLGLYQQILQQGFIEADNSREQTELRLSGLVVQQDSKLQVYNRIYQAVFNLDWLEKELDKLRPYSESIRAWLDSEGQDESRLLRGKALQDALTWAKYKHLGNLDYQFLSASQNLEKREAELQLKTQQEANKLLRRAHRKAQQRIRIGSAILIVSLLASALAIGGAKYAFDRQREAKIGSQLQRIGDSALREFEFDQIGALSSVMEAGQELKKIVQDGRILQDYPATSPLLSLQQILAQIQEKNQLSPSQSRNSSLPIQPEETLNSVSFSPDGKLIATASKNGTVTLWDRQENTQVILRGHQGDVYSVNFSPDGKLIATASRDKTVRIWNLQGKEIATLKGHQGAVFNVSFSPDGKLIATASRDKTVRLWDLQGREIAILKGHQKSVYGISFSPDGKTLATASSDGTVKLWNLQGKELATFPGNSPIYNVSFSPDGKLLATASKDRKATLWNLQGKILVTLQGHQDVVNSINFSPDGKWLATASSDGTAKLWNLTGKNLATFKGHQDIVYDATFSPDGQEIATASSDGTVKFWDLRKLSQANSNKLPNNLTSVSFSPSQTLIAVTSQTGKIYLTNFQGNIEKEFSQGGDWIYSIRFNSKGEQIATASRSGIVQVWDLQGKILAQLEDNSSSAYNLNFSPDRPLLAVAYRDGRVSLWNWRTKQVEKSFQAHPEPIYSLNFSPDGKTIVTASKEGKIKLWDLQGNLKKELTGHPDLVYQVVFSPDGKSLATASRDGSIKLWDWQGNSLAQWQADPLPIYSLNFSPDGGRIATASSDGTARIWDLQGNLRAEFKGQSEAIYGISFTNRGQQLTAVARDGTIKTWQVEEGWQQLDSLLKQGCNWLKDYLISHPQEREKLKVCPNYYS